MVRHHNQAREAGLETEDGQVHHSMARDMYRPTVRFGVVFMLIAGVLLVITGDFQAKIMFEQQPMKMASAEALCETQERSEEHTSELQSRGHLVCRLLLEKKKEERSRTKQSKSVSA